MSKPDNNPLLAKRQENEARFAYVRILELHHAPVQGLFDAAHLREINRRIFQDLPKLGYADVKPGQYRPPVEDGRDWLKTRYLETVRHSLTVAYSAMDQASQKQIEQVLKAADPTRLSTLSVDEFADEIGDLYTNLDYLHPFADGNSRTLRVFTQQLARESGFALDWERFAKTPAGRDQVYIARDLSVNQLALAKVQDPGTQRDIIFSLDIFEGNKDLPALIKEITRPASAVVPR
ncbi:cell filamentation protein [Methylobacillus rhizosphaerae]|uniref:protein adenylyltransferase n=1 Tax=Methylobacillus rhizosphaerae TaxID=551994 RepID=A0A238ZMZ1_9PROT|nr:Fic family protein [Methylobacillus rhizosphaerae]SNR84338.1 cell filamentation protein [Methylobacillus rhizosphaerae]